MPSRKGRVRFAGVLVASAAIAAGVIWGERDGGGRRSGSAVAVQQPVAHELAAPPSVPREATGGTPVGVASPSAASPSLARPSSLAAARPVEETSHAAPAPVAPSIAPAASGMVVAIDPETGQLGMPTPAQMRRHAPIGVEALNQSDAGLPMIHGPGGMVGVDLQGRFQEYYVVRVGPDGRKTIQCAGDPAAIRQALEAPAPAAPRLVEEQ